MTGPDDRHGDWQNARMNRRVFLHVGAPKSGTSYLQDKLGRNRETVASQGIHYLPTRTGDHFEPALDLIEERWAGQLSVAQGQWPALTEAAAGTQGDVLISHEILAAARPDQVSRAMGAFARDEVHLVYTARDLGRQIPAEWQEKVKHRGRITFQSFLDAVVREPRLNPTAWFWRVQSLPDVLTRWGSGLPAGQVHLVTVPPAGASPNELWDRFGSVLGLDPAAPYAESDTANASLGTAETAVLRRLNRKLFDQGVGREVYVPIVREMLVREVLARRDGAVTAVLPEESWPFVEEVTGEWLQWVQSTGVDVVGDLDDLQPRWPQDMSTWRHPDRPGPGRVVDAAVDALAAMVVEAGEHIEDHSTLGRLARRLRRS